MVTHPFEPLYNANSKLLILGSFPSVKSREQMFFYGHPQNRFWRVLSGVFGCETPNTIEEKRTFLLTHGVALWDVIGSCEIIGSSDSSIKNVVVNDISEILNASRIRRIFVNGKTAGKYFNRYIKKQIHKEAICLPSTSPANAAWSVDRLIEAWKIVAEG